jgi:hypothetical protein
MILTPCAPSTARKGVKIHRRSGDIDDGLRAFEIEDVNGYVLCFGKLPWPAQRRLLESSPVRPIGARTDVHSSPAPNVEVCAVRGCGGCRCVLPAPSVSVGLHGARVRVCATNPHNAK